MDGWTQEQTKGTGVFSLSLQKKVSLVKLCGKKQKQHKQQKKTQTKKKYQHSTGQLQANETRTPPHTRTK